MNTLLDWLLNSVHSVNWLLRDVVTMLAVAAETTLGVGLVVPGDTMAVIAGTGIRSVLDFTGLYAFVLLGSFIGETGGFFLGRLFGQRIRTSALGRRLGESKWAMADSFIDARGGLAVGLSRFLPILHSLVPVVSGMSRLPYRVFIRWVMAACAVWALCYVSLGWALHASYEAWLGRLKFGGVIFVGLVVVVFVGITLVKKRLERTAEDISGDGGLERSISDSETQQGME